MWKRRLVLASVSVALLSCEPSVSAPQPVAAAHDAEAEFIAYLDKRNAAKGNPAELARIDEEIRKKYEKPLGVMITDMSGMTALTKANGIIGILGIIREMERMCVPILEKNGGHFVKMEADDIFGTSPSAKGLYTAAREMLATIAKHHKDTGDTSIKMGIGLGWGLTLDIAGEELWGDAVNTASKLGEDTAEPGEILISDDFHKALVAEGVTPAECTLVDPTARKATFAYYTCK